jgi:hypothetical protein
MRARAVCCWRAVADHANLGHENPKVPHLMSEPHTFTVGGRQFRLKHLTPIPALKGLSPLTEAIIPMVSAGFDGLSPAAVPMIVRGIERLEELVTLFALRCEVQWETGAFISLGTPMALDTVFEGKTVDLLEWLIECLVFQYSDFLAANGLARLVARVSQFASQSGLTGASGVSP